MKSEEIIWIRNIRVLASIAVVAVHVCWRVMYYFRLHSYFDLQIVFLIDAIGHSAVPLFLMISGALILPKIPSKFGKRFLKVIYLIIFWSIFYTIFNIIINKNAFSINGFFNDLLRADAYSHLYYLYVIAGLYLVTPILQKIIAGSRKRTFVLALITLLIPVIWALVSFISNGEIINPIAPLRFVIYIGYYVLGYYLSAYLLKERWVKMPIILSLILSGIIFSYLVVEITKVSSYCFHYLSLGIISSTIGFFILFKDKLNSKKIFSKIKSPSTLGIYLLHPALIILFEYFTLINGAIFHPFVGIPLTIFLVYFSSWLIVRLVEKTPLKIMVN